MVPDDFVNPWTALAALAVKNSSKLTNIKKGTETFINYSIARRRGKTGH